MRKLLIVGISSDIGLHYLRHLAKSGERHVVWGTYRTENADLWTIAKSSANLDLQLAKVDLSKSNEVDAWLDSFEECVPAEILHLAADKFQYMRYKNFDWEKTRYQMEIQLHSFIQITKKFLPSMTADKYGNIVVMLTAYTLGVPPKFMSNYIMIKYALLGLVRSIASEYAGKGVRINAVSPNMIETKFLSGIDSRLLELNASGAAMKRNSTLDEVIGGIEYLFSKESSYCSGTNLNLSGGDYM